VHQGRPVAAEGRAIIDSGRGAGDYPSKIIRNEIAAIPVIAQSDQTILSVHWVHLGNKIPNSREIAPFGNSKTEM